MKTLLDTNVLVHAHNYDSPHQQKASETLRDALAVEFEACIAAQVLYEFFDVVTNSRRVDRPLSISQSTSICEDLWMSGAIEVIEPQNTTSLLVFDLAREHGLTGPQIFDCVLAATAKENAVTRIFTENTRDFEIYDFLSVVNPFG